MNIEQNFVKQVGLFSLYQGSVSLFHILIISFVSFFHFQLDHGITTLETWVYEHGWGIIILTKGISFLVIYKFLIMYSSRPLLKGFVVERNFFHYKKRSFIFLVFFLFFFLFLGRPAIAESFSLDLYELVVSFFGLTFFYGIDFFVLLFLSILFPLKNKIQSIGVRVIFTLLFIGVSLMTFLYQRNMGFMTFFFFFVLTSFIGEEDFKWNISLYFLLFLILPFSMFFGLDPLKGGEFSPFFMTQDLQPIILIFLFGISFLYLDGRFLKYIKGVSENGSI